MLSKLILAATISIAAFAGGCTISAHPGGVAYTTPRPVVYAPRPVVVSRPAYVYPSVHVHHGHHHHGHHNVYYRHH